MSKICKNCGTEAEDGLAVCESCGQPFEEEAPQTTLNGEPVGDAAGEAGKAPAGDGFYVYKSDSVELPDVKTGNGNVVAGVVGALLFSLGGAVIHFALTQIGYVAALSGLIMFVLANFGYGLFSGRKNTVAGVVTAVIVTIIMIFVAEYFSVAFLIWQEAKKEYEVSLFDAIRVMPEVLSDPESRAEFLKELLLSYVFGAVGVVSTIIARKKEGKIGGRKI